MLSNIVQNMEKLFAYNSWYLRNYIVPCVSISSRGIANGYFCGRFPLMESREKSLDETKHRTKSAILSHNSRVAAL